jgi:hypothetical protein
MLLEIMSIIADLSRYPDRPIRPAQMKKEAVRPRSTKAGSATTASLMFLLSKVISIGISVERVHTESSY